MLQSIYRSLFWSFCTFILSLTIFSPSYAQSARNTSVEMIFNDPQAPMAGNPKGDLTIINFTDYNCPYCKNMAPLLEKLIAEDGNIRLVYKDWPILRPTSRPAAELVLAARYQDKYIDAHNALMSITGRAVTEEKMRETLEKSGIDIKKLDADRITHKADIDVLLERNADQANILGLTGTPSFLIGKFKAGAMDYETLKQVVNVVRQRQASSSVQ